MTCESANDGKNYVELPGAINRLGRITKVVHFNVLNTAEALVTSLENTDLNKLTLIDIALIADR